MQPVNLAAWTIDETEFPASGSVAEKLHFLVRYAVLAPSGHNTQPWRFVVSENTIELWGDPARRLPLADPNDRELILSCGAALLNLRIAIHHFGYSSEIKLLPSADEALLLARVRLGGPLHWKPDDRLFRAILMRHTDRGDFDHRRIAATILAGLEAAAAFEGATLMIVESERIRNSIAASIEEADHIQAHDGRYRSELARWLRPNRTSKNDGMPGYALGLGGLTSLLAPSLVRNFEFDQADEDRRQIMETPELAVLWTAGDNTLDWLTAGQALGRVLLRAYSEAVHASFFTQVLEVERTRTELHRMMALPGYAQMILRIGYGKPDLKPTPRRPADEVTS